MDSQNANIAGDFCGQMQPHAAHVWNTPVPYGSMAITMPRQCAGLIDPSGQEDK